MGFKRSSCVSHPARTKVKSENVLEPALLLGSTFLEKIPWDIWLYIAGFLELSDEVSLSLVCKRLAILLRSSWVRLNEDKQQKLLFLRRLDSNLPEHRFCSACFKYHRRNRKDERQWLRTQPQNVCGERAIPLLSGIYLNWPSLQMALRARQLGSIKFGLCLDSMPRRLPSTFDDSEDLKWQHALHFWSSEGRLILIVDSYRIYCGDSQRLSQFARGYLIDVIPHEDHPYLHARRLIDAASLDCWVRPQLPGWCPAAKHTHSWYNWSTAHWDPRAGLPGLHWTELSLERRALGIPEWSNWRFDDKTGQPIDPRSALQQKLNKLILLAP